MNHHTSLNHRLPLNDRVVAPMILIPAFLLLVTMPIVARAAVPALHVFHSRSYAIHTNLDQDEVMQFARHMDAMFAVYRRRFNGFRSRRAGEMPLYLLRTRAQYISFMAKNGINADNSGGMFFITNDIQGLATWTQDRSRSQTFEVLQHEGFHQFAYNYIGPNLPVWANEGLAQYFEDAIIVSGRMKTGLANARRLAMVQQALRKGSAVKLDALLKTTSQQWQDTLHAAPERSALLYAQSWSVVYFLIHGDGGRYQQAFLHYLMLLSDGHDSKQSFDDVFGVGRDLTPMARRWRHFVLNQKPDPINAATAKLAFLGGALEYMKQHDAPMPKSLDELHHYLAARHFRLTQQGNSLSIVYDATDPANFRYTRSDGKEASFKLLPPSDPDLPPRITAPNLHPTPTLVWSRDQAGKLVRDVEYR